MAFTPYNPSQKLGGFTPYEPKKPRGFEDLPRPLTREQAGISSVPTKSLRDKALSLIETESVQERAFGAGTQIAGVIEGAREEKKEARAMREEKPIRSLIKELSSYADYLQVPIAGAIGFFEPELKAEVEKFINEPGPKKVIELFQKAKEQPQIKAAIQSNFGQEALDVGEDLLSIAAPFLGVSAAVGEVKAAQRTIKSTKQLLQEMGQIGATTKAKAINVFTRETPVKVIENSLGLTPTERLKVENISGKPPAAFVLEKQLSKDKVEMVNELQKIADDSYNGITEQIKQVPQVKNASPNAVKMLETMTEEMESSAILRREYPEYISKLKSLAEEGAYTLIERNAIRRDFDRIIGHKLFNAQGRVTGAENKAIAAWRDTLSTEIQTEALTHGIDVKSINKDLRTSIVMRDGVLRRLSQENKNNQIGLQDIGIGAILAGGDPVTAAGIIVAKKTLSSYAPDIAQAAYNLNKKPYESLDLRRGVGIKPRDVSKGFSLTDNINDGELLPKKLKPLKKETATFETNIEGEGAFKQAGIDEKSLVSEAKKFNVVESFYHGGESKITKIDPKKGGGFLGEGFYLARDKNVAKDFGRIVSKKPVITEMKIDPKKTLNLDDPLSKDQIDFLVDNNLLTDQQVLLTIKGEKTLKGILDKTEGLVEHSPKIIIEKLLKQADKNIVKFDDVVVIKKTPKEIVVYRAGKLRDGKKDLKGDYFATTKNYAETFKDRGDVKKFRVSKDANILLEKDLPSDLKLGEGSAVSAEELRKAGGIGGLQNKAYQYAKKKGYDGFYWSDKELNIINREILL